MKRIVYVVALLGLTLGHECIHSTMTWKKPLSSIQFYDEHPHADTVRHLSAEIDASSSISMTTTNPYQPIRITPIFDTSLNQLSQDQQNFIKSKLVADALTFWSQTLQVIPINGPWYAQRNCLATWQTSPPTCQAYDTTQSCMEATIPSSHFAPLRVCSKCNDNTCSSGPCTNAPSGNGVPNTDYVLYVQAVQTSNCGSSVLAYATSCQLDQYDRPTMGMVNFCPGKLNTNPTVYDKQLNTATHEIAHALGFTSQMFPYMRNPDGTPRTPRDANGQPPILTNYKCPNGYISDAIQMPSEKTIQFFQERGHSVAKLVTPNVLAFVRSYFNCPTLNGAEIEDQDGSCLGSHWEERIFEPELMSPLQSYRNPVSGLTLSFFQDSGWYQVNFTSAQPMYWGANRGCDFALNKCIETVNNQLSLSASDHFCIDTNTDSCSMDLTSRAVCTLRTSNEIIPLYNQYFSNSGLGGASFPDFCPLYTGYLGGDCYLSSNLQFPQGTTINLLGEIYSTNSYCMKSSLLTTNNQGWSIPGRASGCYRASCDKNGVITIYIAGSSGEIETTCTQKGQSMTISGFNGVLLCPDPSIVCSGGKCSPSCGSNSFCSGSQCICFDGYTMNTQQICVSICPNGCSGNGICNSKTATCTCNNEYTGIDCSNLKKKNNSIILLNKNLIIIIILYIII